MRSLCLLIVSWFYCFTATSQGIHFEKNISWNEVLSIAKDAHKMVFVDVYTDWCGPCQRMNKQVFTLRETGDKFNHDFINYQLNAEKGEGPMLKRKYHITSYPTYLFVRGDGTLIYKARGAMPPQQLAKEANNALSEANEPITIIKMDRLYPSHQKDQDFMYAYVKRRTRLGLDNANLLDEYFSLLNAKEQGLLKNLQLVVDNGSFLNKNLQIGPAYEALIRNRNKFHLLKTNEYNNNLIAITNTAMEKTLTKAVREKNRKLLDEVLKLNTGTNAFNNDNVIKLHYLWGTKEYEKYIGLAEIYVDSQLMALSDSTLDRMDKQVYDEIIPGIDSSLSKKTGLTKQEKENIRYSYKRTKTARVARALWSMSKNVIDITTNKDTIKRCLPWIRRCVYLAGKDTAYFRDGYPPFLDIYARYLYALNKKQEAIENEQKAIDFIKNRAKNKVPEEYVERLLRMKNNTSLDRRN